MRLDLVTRCFAIGLDVSWGELASGTPGGVGVVDVVGFSGAEGELVSSMVEEEVLATRSSGAGEEEEGEEGKPVSSKVGGEVEVVAT